MPPDDGFSDWAALFLRNYGGDEALSAPARPSGAAGDAGAGLTQAARELLIAVDAGGVPAFVTSNLKQIALENGIEVTASSTPNEIIAAVRSKA